MNSILLLEVFLKITEDEYISLVMSNSIGDAEYKESKYTHHEVEDCRSFEFSFVEEYIEEYAEELL